MPRRQLRINWDKPKKPDVKDSGKKPKPLTRAVRDTITSLQGNSVSEITLRKTVVGGRVSRTILKKLWPQSVRELPRWRRIHSILRKSKIPTFPDFDAFKKEDGSVFLRQKDYSKTGNAPLIDAWRVTSFGKAEKNQKTILGMVRDLAIMHRRGIAVNPKELLFSPWIVYRKPNGKWDRAIVDLGSIIIPENRPSAIQSNFNFLLPFLASQERAFAELALKKYFEYNPNSALRNNAKRFFS